jgi:hypothetical protein
MIDREPLMREARSGSGTRSRSSVASPAGPGPRGPSEGLPCAANRRIIGLQEPGSGESRLYPMYMGWSINYQSVNLDSWNSWPEQVRQFFLEQFDAFENKMWETAAKAVADAENCNFGKEPCEMGNLV